MPSVFFGRLNYISAVRSTYHLKRINFPVLQIGRVPFNSTAYTCLNMSNNEEKPVTAIHTSESSESIATDSSEKSKNQKKNELKKAEKLAKFQAKKAAQAKLAAEKAAKGKSAKVEKDESVAAVNVEEFVNTTPLGEKKDVSGECPAAYNPIAVESAWYSWWEKSGFFKPEINMKNDVLPEEGAYVIPIPPPNVTGSLHIGHALTNSIQDTLMRWNRMKGKASLFVPGCDHAGIATQIVVEKKLAREKNITRHDLGREKFLEEVFKWKDVYGDKIYDQIKRLGSSMDWDRVKFTMDADLADAVKEAFVKLHDEGVIYRDNRLVNWDTKLKTALSNLEVENKELAGRTLISVPDHDPKKKYEFGVIISFKYPIEGTDEFLTVATTRIETMLGDTAIAVNPKDARYSHLVGKFVKHPFQDRKIPIIADEYVDIEFGTGAVKITPAHDFNDYIVGKRNKLEFINILTDDGHLNEKGAPFTGLKRFDAREAVIKALKEKGLYVETKDNKMVLPICDRTGNVVEPMIKPQWWINCKELAKDAADAVRNGQLEITPSASEKEWFRWMDNIQDWCISRQLWWGHRVPAYFIHFEDESNVEEARNDSELWVSGRSEDEARERATKKYPGRVFTLEQDEDVLDTWFSSGLWPFSIMGWPNKTKDFENFYPNTLLETGWDILFFWVARMVMLGLKLTGKIPFKKVFCHAMVRDAHGRKMSKSLGNVIDPVSVIEGISLEDLQNTLLGGNLAESEIKKAQEGQRKDFPSGIPQCGTDALRFTLVSCTAAGRDLNLDILRVEGYRKWCNKLWNATRFALQKLGSDYKAPEQIKLSGNESPADKWILYKLNDCTNKVNGYLEQMNFMQACNTLYQFWLYELCDVYLESIKPIVDNDNTDPKLKQAAKDTLYICLESGLKLLHPIMPYVTEELYQRLPRRLNDSIPSIMITRYPEYRKEWDVQQWEQDYDLINNIVKNARSMVSQYAIKNGKIFIKSSNANKQTLSESQKEIIISLIKGVVEAEIITSEIPSGCSLLSVDDETTVALLVKGYINFDEEVGKVEKKLKKAEDLLASWVKKTQIPDYETKIAANVREQNDQKIKTYEADVLALKQSIENFEKLRN